MIKSLANMLEWLSVGALLIGLYKDDLWAVGLGAVILVACLALTWLDEKRRKGRPD